MFTKAETFIIDACWRPQKDGFRSSKAGGGGDDDDAVGERGGAPVGGGLGGHGQRRPQPGHGHGVGVGGDGDGVAIRRRRHRTLRQRHGTRTGARRQGLRERNPAHQRRLRAHERDGQRDGAGGLHQHGHHQLAAGRSGRANSVRRLVQHAAPNAKERILHPPEQPGLHGQWHAGLAVNDAGGRGGHGQDVHGAVRHCAHAGRPHQPLVGAEGVGGGGRHSEFVGGEEPGVQCLGRCVAHHVAEAELRVYGHGRADGDQVREHVGEVWPHDRQRADPEREARAGRGSAGQDGGCVPTLCAPADASGAAGVSAAAAAPALGVPLVQTDMQARLHVCALVKSFDGD